MKKEAQAADESRHGQTGDGEPSQQAHTAEDAGPGGGFVFQPHAMAGAGERKIGVRAIDTKELEGGHDEIRPKKRGGGHEAGDEQAGGSRSQEKQKRKRQGHRPDPFHEAKVRLPYTVSVQSTYLRYFAGAEALVKAPTYTLKPNIERIY